MAATVLNLALLAVFVIVMVFCPVRSSFAGKVIRSSENGPWSPKPLIET